MLKYSVVNDVHPESWNSFLETFSNGNFEQCFEYGEVVKKVYPRTKVIRLACLQGREIAGLVQGTYSKYLGFGATLGVRRGPIINFKDKNHLIALKYLLNALDDYARKERIVEISIQIPKAWQLINAFTSSGYFVAGELNEYVVRLKNSSDDLWKNISHNKRKNIKKAIREGVEVFESRRKEDLQTFYLMLKASEKRKGFKSYPYSWFETIWDIYKPNLSKVFLAVWKGKKLAGVFIVIHGKTVYAVAAGSLTEGWKVRCNDILHWKVMEWACKQGYTLYHMGFVPQPPPCKHSREWGIWRWKREWKGELYRLIQLKKVTMSKYNPIRISKMILGKIIQ